MNLTRASFIRTVAVSTLTKLASGFKVSCILGSYAACFSLIAVVMPLSGLWCGMWGSSAVFFCALLMRMVGYGFSLPFHYLAYHIPGLFAAYYWASRSMVIRVVLPIVCMGLFVMHPEGARAWPYAMYWLIPATVGFLGTRSLFAQALGSTFTAHAIGSVIWIYTVPMTASQWLSLIPIVCIERFTFALGMVLVYRLVSRSAMALRIMHFFPRWVHI